MMSSLLFYHKKENPLTGIIDSEGWRNQAVLLGVDFNAEIDYHE